MLQPCHVLTTWAHELRNHIMADPQINRACKWELYAMWVAVPIFFSEFFRTRSASDLHAYALSGTVAFAVIGAGAVGSVLAGRWAGRLGRERITIWAMAAGGACALLMGWLLFASARLAVGVGLVWVSPHVFLLLRVVGWPRLIWSTNVSLFVVQHRVGEQVQYLVRRVRRAAHQGLDVARLGGRAPRQAVPALRANATCPWAAALPPRSPTPTRGSVPPPESRPP